MLDHALEGGFAQAPQQAAAGFRAALSALARPGRIETIEGATGPAPMSVAAATLVLTLVDAETPIYLGAGHDSPAVRQWIAFHTGAPIVPAARAHEAMFALGHWEDLMPLGQFAHGTAEYPDRSATLIVEVEAHAPPTHHLTGPGIEISAEMRLPSGIDARRDMAFPLGVDFYFSAGHHITALPRSTRVEDL